MKRVGPYTILRRLGEGAFAKVYLAKMEGPGGFVTYRAVKRLHQRVLEGAFSAERFVREARIGGLVNHPNVVRILEVHELGGELLIGMEYVDGVTLKALFSSMRKRDRRVPPAALYEVIEAVLRALAHIHALRDPEGDVHAVVHRDVKPGNVMITPDGVVKLMDFGVAKAAFGAQTSTGVAIGTPRYMAPEQARGEPVDRRADLFAAGAVLFEGLMGRRILDKTSTTEARIRLAANDLTADFKALRAALDPAVAGVVLHLMAPSPAHRPDTARDAADLVAELRGPRTAPALARFCARHPELFPRAPLPEDPSWSGPRIPRPRLERTQIDSTELLAPTEIERVPRTPPPPVQVPAASPPPPRRGPVHHPPERDGASRVRDRRSLVFGAVLAGLAVVVAAASLLGPPAFEPLPTAAVQLAVPTRPEPVEDSLESVVIEADVQREIEAVRARASARSAAPPPSSPSEPIAPPVDPELVPEDGALPSEGAIVRSSDAGEELVGPSTAPAVRIEDAAPVAAGGPGAGMVDGARPRQTRGETVHLRVHTPPTVTKVTLHYSWRSATTQRQTRMDEEDVGIFTAELTPPSRRVDRLRYWFEGQPGDLRLHEEEPGTVLLR